MPSKAYEAFKENVQDIERLMEDELPTLGSQFAEDAAGPNVFAKLARYERAIENSLYRAPYELRRRQAARGKQDLSPMLAVDVTPAAI